MFETSDRAGRVSYNVRKTTEFILTRSFRYGIVSIVTQGRSQDRSQGRSFQDMFVCVARMEGVSSVTLMFGTFTLFGSKTAETGRDKSVPHVSRG